MRLASFTGVLLTVAPSFAAADEYIWPSRYDELEDILSLQSGYLGRNFSSAVTPCTQGGNVKGRQNAAEWIRSAFHDMITHDSALGTGGLDGSIWFELDRAENGALAFENTFNFFAYLHSLRASAADLLAMSVIVSHSGCGGTTRIPFRAGTMLERFAMAGYSQEDMITLVACGHTLGGVHSHDHPDIVPGESGDRYNDTVVKFDTTDGEFDNAVAVEYLSGNTQNPLVVGKNETKNSDKRIFSSDNNATIFRLAGDNAEFEKTCAKVFERMIDTVPSTVELSQPIEPIDIKPYITDLYLNDNGKLVFSGRIRIRTTEGAAAGRLASDLDVQVHHAVRNKRWSCARINTTYAGDAQGLYGETFAWYEFHMELNATKGISKFNIETTVRSTGERMLYDNGGEGYPVTDELLYQRADSCVARQAVNGLRAMEATVAVRKDRATLPLKLELARYTKMTGLVVREWEVETVLFANTGETRGEDDGWVIFKAPTGLKTASWLTWFDIIQEGDDGSRIEFLKTEACPRTSS
uniref:Uncharacterized protein n=1 Tax=Bionectria ochroleuca TaxID=29856 RepID=A0A0B7JYH8_BIOOC